MKNWLTLPKTCITDKSKGVSSSYQRVSQAKSLTYLKEHKALCVADEFTDLFFG